MIYCQTCQRNYSAKYYQRAHSRTHENTNSRKKGNIACPLMNEYGQKCGKLYCLKSLRIHMIDKCEYRKDKEQDARIAWKKFLIVLNRRKAQHQVQQIVHEQFQQHTPVRPPNQPAGLSMRLRSSRSDNFFKLSDKNELQLVPIILNFDLQ